jgi:C2 domain
VHDEEKESLTVVVIGARNLAARDKDGLADPYCEITVGDEQVETHAIPRNRAPRWACEFTLPVSGGGAGQELVARVIDRASSSFMGECRLSLDGFLDTPLRYAAEHACRCLFLF